MSNTLIFILFTIAMSRFPAGKEWFDNNQDAFSVLFIACALIDAFRLVKVIAEVATKKS